MQALYKYTSLFLRLESSCKALAPNAWTAFPNGCGFKLGPFFVPPGYGPPPPPPFVDYYYHHGGKGHGQYHGQEDEYGGKGHGGYHGQGYEYADRGHGGGYESPEEWEQDDDRHPQLTTEDVDVRNGAL